MPIDRESTSQTTKGDRADSPTDRPVAEAYERLQRFGVGERQSSGRLAKSSPQSEEGDAIAESHDRALRSEEIARTTALRKLTTRACTRHELDQALQAKNVPESVKDSVLDRLQEIGLVDDASFAVDWVGSRQQRRHLSHRALRRELEAKGVGPSDIDRALDSMDPDAELTSARALVARKQARMKGLAREVQYRRLAGILGRRGFDASVIKRALADVLVE
jgi:regulatory protein